MAGPSVGIDGSCPVALDKLPDGATTERAAVAPGEVVRLDVDPAQEARLARLVGGVEVRRPLELDVLCGPQLELQAALGNRVVAQSAWEVRRARVRRQHLCGRAAERAVTGGKAR